MSSVKVTQTKSTNGSTQNQIATLQTLGLRRIGQTVDVADSPESRGRLHTVRHLISVEETGS